MEVKEYDDKKITLTDDGVFYTIQGEGKFVGAPSVFVRLSACNLRCEWSNGDGTFTKCDTPYSSHQPEKNLQTIKDIIADIVKHNCHKVVITGGEPMLQTNVTFLIDELVKLGKHVTVETNGTIYRDCKTSFYSISPKLATSCPHTSENFEMHHSKRLNLPALLDLVKKPHQLKFVVNSKHDIAEIQTLVRMIAASNGGYDCSNVYVMPQGVSVEQFDKRMPWIIDAAKENGWNVSDRLHVRLWGHKRGV